MASAASLSYFASWIETYVRSHEQMIKNILDYVNISEARYDDIVVAANGFSVVGPGAPLISFGLCFILVLHMAASVWYVSVLFKYIYTPLLTKLIHIRVHDLSG